MRIQHNITAMNAYRNYTNNTSALAKNLEKLSSGYKINRAGDDAAGLAISEKMRAQITGLEVAQKNAKDGISLVQTAEGALTEVHDMLNRMYELAEQSANGTYDDEVDRAQLQKEIDSLSSEIDRIADSSNFNGIKLLDGSLTVKDAVTSKVDVGNLITDGKGMDRILTSVLEKGDRPSDVAGKKTIFDKAAATATGGSFYIDLAEGDLAFDVKIKATSSATFTANTFSVTIGDKTFTLGSTASKGAITITATASQIANGTYTVNYKNAAGTATATAASITASVVAAAIFNSAKAEAGASASATSVKVTINNTEFKMSVDGGKLKFEHVSIPETEEEAQLNFDVSVKLDTTSSAASKGSVSITGAIPAGTHVDKVAVSKEAKYLANTVFAMKDSDIVDGAVITLGTKTFVLSVGKNSTVTSSSAAQKIGGSNAIRVNLTSMEEGNVDLDKALGAIYDKSGGTFSVQVKYTTASGAAATATIGFNLTVSDNSQGFPAGLAIQRATAATASAAAATIFDSLDKLGSIFEIKGGASKMEDVVTPAQTGLALQIGDSADSFNQLVVSIDDMHTGAMGIGDIDISSQDGATDAMAKVKAAINYVSNTRGTLGATQNRLDHTINNLSVMQENIQDAESSIRDVDVAEEMMEYTKNNILVQSAQAMLAQANQMPQGVLQLLQ